MRPLSVFAAFVSGLRPAARTLICALFVLALHPSAGWASAPPTPTGLAAQAGNAQVTLTWTASTGATSYNAYRAASSGGTYTKVNTSAISASPYTNTGLRNGTPYWFKVTAVGSGGESAQSGFVTATPLAAPAAPTGFTATASSTTQINLAWTASPTASSYNIYRGTTAGGESATAIATGVTTTSKSDTGLTAGTHYFYTVKAVNAAGTSPASAEANAFTIPAAPTGLAASPGNASITLTWSAATGAASYNVYRATSSAGTYGKINTGTVTSPTYLDSGRTNGTPLWYKVSAVNPGGEGALSGSATATPLLPAPTGLTAMSLAAGQVTLTWPSVPNATGYNIYRGTTTGGESSTALAGSPVSGTTFTDTGRTSGTKYYYKIKATSASNTSSYSNEASATVIPPVPVGVSVYASPGGITVSFNSSAGADSYNIKRSQASNGVYSTVATQTQISGNSSYYVSDTSGSAATTYFYVVTAVNAGGETAPSSPPASATTYTTTPISCGQTINGSLTTTDSTSPEYGSSYYADFYSFTATAGQTITFSLATPSYGGLLVLSNSTGGMVYACGQTGNSNNQTASYSIPTSGTYAVEVTTTTALATGPYTLSQSCYNGPPPPINLVATPISGQVQLSWTDNGITTGYNIKRGTIPGGPYPTVVASGTNTIPYLDSPTPNGSTYYYVVTAVNALGESLNSNEASVIPQGPPPSPTGLYAVANGPNQISVNWSYVAAASYYYLQRSPDGTTGWTTVVVYSDANDHYYRDNTGLSPNTTYYYRVFASSPAGGNSPYSNIANATTFLAAPTNLTATAGVRKITLSWTAPAGASVYHIQRADVTGGPYTVVGTANNTTTFIDPNLSAHGYYYVVTAVNAGGDSFPSNEASALPTDANGSVVYNIDCGGPADAPYIADELYAGNSSAYAIPATYDISAVTNPAPQDVYVHGRSGDFTYTIPGLQPSASYTLRLHFTEALHDATGQRLFNVTINGSQVLTSFDVLAAAGGKYKVIAEAFNATADSNGNITIGFVSMGVDVAMVSAIDVYTGSSLPSKTLELTATPGNAQVTLNWVGPNATSYNVKRSTTKGGPYATIATNITAATYPDNSGLTNSTIYYYVVSGVNGLGEGQNSNEASAMPFASSALDINCGGGAAPPFVADQNFTGGNTYVNPVYVDTSGVVNPAPQAVYQTQRNGTFSYAVTGLTSGQTYTLRLHFAEIAGDVTVPGQRVFDVLVNGSKVLSAFDILSATGSLYKAVVEQFNVQADGTGTINIATNPILYNPVMNGIELGSGPSAPATPYNLTAVSGNAQVTLKWASVVGATSYNVKRSNTSGGPYSIIGTATATTVIDQPLTNGSTYYYVVSAIAAGLESTNSNEAIGAPMGTNASVLRINSGGNAVGLFTGDQMYIGGGPDTVLNSIDVSGVASAAPVAVYQSRRNYFDAFSYSLSGLQPTGAYTVRLHFAELYGLLPSLRLEDVSINGALVLPSFDIAAAAGADNRAVVEQFNATADSSGIITLNFARTLTSDQNHLTGTNNTQVNGIEMLSGFSAPSAPNNLIAIPGNNQVSLYWTALSGATGYNVKRRLSGSGSFTTLPGGANVSGATYIDATAVNGTAYDYVVTALNAYGESANSNVASATPMATGAEEYRVNGGGPAVGAYALDQYFVGGGGEVRTVTIDTSAVSNPAPMAAYQSRHIDPAGFAYTFPHLAPGAIYTVRLHFAEMDATRPGLRYFSVVINGITVLSHVDLFQVAGAMNKAFVMPYATTATPGGTIVVRFTGELQFAQVNAIEILTGNTLPPAAPTNLRAELGATQVGLVWFPVVGANSYNVWRGTVSGGPYSRIASGVTSPSYSDPVNANNATYYYVVTAVSAIGESARSNEATPIPPFTLSANPAALSILLGQGGISTITASSALGFVDPIQITITGVTPNLTAMCYPGAIPISPQQPFPNSLMNGTTKLHVCSVGGAPSTYTLTIRGISGDYSASTTITVTTN